MFDCTTQVKHAGFYAAIIITIVVHNRIWTYYYHKNSRNKRQNVLINDRDVGMKKAQKQDVIQNGTIFGILCPFLHSANHDLYSSM